MDEIAARCSVVRGAGHPTATTMAALDSDCEVVLLVGHHACAGSNPGIMAHTICYGKFKAVRLAGRPVGESELFAIRAGASGALERLGAGELQRYRGELAPYEFEVELRGPMCDDMRSNLETMEEFEVEGDQLVRIIAEDLDLGFRRVAYPGFANLPGVTRY